MKILSNLLAFGFGALMILCSTAIIHTTGLAVEWSAGASIGLAVTTSLVDKYTSINFSKYSFMATCGKISASIAISCDNPVQAGTRDRGIIINFEDIDSVTYAGDGETITDITLAGGAVAYQIDGQNNSIEPKMLMIEQGFNNMFDHEVMMKGFDISPATKNEVNSMKDGRFVVITENYFRGVGGDAAFEVYGISTGLELTEIERDPNSEETQGAFHFKFFTKKNKEPKVPNTLFDTDYATSKAVVDGLLV